VRHTGRGADLPVTTEIFRAHPGIGPAAAPVVVVQHLRADTAAFLALMHACGWRLASVLAIPYSSSPDAVAVVRQLGVRVLEPTLDDLSGALAAELLQVHATTGERVLVHEVGGYLADLLAVRPEFASMVDAAVEETKQGLWRYQRLPDLQLPVLQIADSPLKQIEARYVGAAVGLSTLELLRSMGVETIGRPMGIVGYGDIGSAAARFARGLGNPTYVFDIDPTRMIAACADGFTVLPAEKLVQACRVIVGCSGRPSIDPSWFAPVQGRYYLASGSSRQIEMSRLLRALPDAGQPAGRVQLDSRYGDVPCLRLQFPTADVMVLNAGMPVNFLGESLPYSVIDLVFAQVAAGMVVLASSKVPPGVHPLGATDQSHIAHLWTDRYLTNPLHF